MTNNERKECISALRQLLAMCDFVDQYGDCIDADPYFDAVETAIESLNETGWIPVSERLPGKNGCYLVSTTGTNNDIIDIAYYIEGLWHKGSRIKAWMPLPEPYKGGDDSE